MVDALNFLITNNLNFEAFSISKMYVHTQDLLYVFAFFVNLNKLLIF